MTTEQCVIFALLSGGGLFFAGIIIGFSEAVKILCDEPDLYERMKALRRRRG